MLLVNLRKRKVQSATKKAFDRIGGQHIQDEHHVPPATLDFARRLGAGDTYPAVVSLRSPI